MSIRTRTEPPAWVVAQQAGRLLTFAALTALTFGHAHAQPFVP
jgi:hypothetical protein